MSHCRTNPHSSDIKDSDSYARRRSVRTRTRARTHEWQKHLLSPDIANCLVFSKLRYLISIVSILLLATDIPRSGLGVRRLNQFYTAQIMPDTAIRFGPYDYSVRQIWRTEVDNSNNTEAFHALEGTDPVDSAKVWSYKYDTTSLGLRGAVELLNVTGYPDFLLYRDDFGRAKDQHAVLGLNTTFLMLDALISAAKGQMISRGNTDDVSWSSFRFATKHNWVDRVHQFLMHFIRQERIWSLHSLHVPQIHHRTKSLRFCTTTTPSLHPRFCTYPGIWKCEHPSDPSLPPVQLSEQMDIRFQEFQRRYPGLMLDVALFSTHRPSMTSGTLSYTFSTARSKKL